jgi:pantoate--beta-alanine ligase
MHCVTSAGEFAAYRARFDAGCVLVPTMGALHEGHASLIRAGAALARARALWAGCVVTIFVNPTQFNEPADYERYPRTPEADAAICRRAGAACLFMPEVREVYPDGTDGPAPFLPPVATAPRLEDAHRPGHFAGVCRVVHRLFEMVRPAAAVFGEKDWQQLQVVRALAASLHPRLDIVAAPTVREPDGLAQSSRNRFLTPAHRALAPAIRGALLAAREARTPDEGERRMHDVLARAGIRPEYAVIRDAATLLRPAGGTAPSWRALIAARLGDVRLIDNDAWSPA